MDTTLTYRRRQIGPDEVTFIQSVVDRHWEAGRTVISQELCRQWDWRQPNGHLKEIVCRGLLLKLERAGQLRLPPSRRHGVYPGRKPRVEPVSLDTSLIQGSLQELLPIDWVQVRRSGAREALFDHLIASYHYLGYCQTVGEHLKYLAFSGGRPIACLAWGSAAWKVDCRDSFIGWSAVSRQENLFRVVNNTRFLIPPFVQVPNLASWLLSRNVRQLPCDWQRLYAHRPVLLETFVEVERFTAACYRAANWMRLGTTRGRGKYDRYKRRDQPVKAVFVYPLHKHFRGLLCHG